MSRGLGDVYKRQARMRDVRTLAFPLAEAGDFRSRVTNLEVHRLK